MKARDCWSLLEGILPHTRRALLYGPPGTGKTHITTYLGLNDSKQVFSITLDEGTPSAELRGFFHPKGHEFVWMDGPAIMAWRTGGDLILNEINNASQEVLTLLYVLLDDPATARITLPTGETVAPHPDFRAFATMNGLPEDLPPALQDRFAVHIHVNKTNPEAIKALIPYRFRAIVRKTCDLTDARRVTLREWLAFFKALESGVHADIVGLSILGEQRWGGLRETLLLAAAETPSTDI